MTTPKPPAPLPRDEAVKPGVQYVSRRSTWPFMANLPKTFDGGHSGNPNLCKRCGWNLIYHEGADLTCKDDPFGPRD